MSFIDDMRDKHSKESIQKEQQKKIAAKGDYFIYGVILAIKYDIDKNYDKHYLEGYVGKNVGYDSREHHIIQLKNRNKEARATNSDIYIIENEPDVIDYILKNLPVEIRKLGITDFSFSHELVQKKKEMYEIYLAGANIVMSVSPGLLFT